jgi:hypothetical protein
MSKNEVWFKRSDGVTLAAEEDSHSYKMMMKGGEFTRINTDGSEYIEPVSAEEVTAEAPDQVPAKEKSTGGKAGTGAKTSEKPKAGAKGKGKKTPKAKEDPPPASDASPPVATDKTDGKIETPIAAPIEEIPSE